MSKPIRTSSYRLPPETIKRLDEIAAHLTLKRKTRRPMNRTDVICYLADNFRLPARPIDRPTIVETTEE